MPLIWLNQHFCYLEQSKNFPELYILDSSKLQQFADDSFKFDENGEKFSKRVENTVEKGELLVTNNISISYSVFKRIYIVLQTHKNQGLNGKGYKKRSSKFHTDCSFGVLRRV